MMTIVFILLLTVISIALRLASLSIRAYKKIGDRKSKMIEEGTVDAPDFNSKLWNTKAAVAGATAGMLKTAGTVVAMLRAILAMSAPIIISVEILIGIFLVITSSGFSTFFSDTNLPASTNESSYNGNSNNGNSNNNSSEPDDEDTKILLIGGSRTVYLAQYVHGFTLSEDRTAIGSTSDGDYIMSKLDSGLDWAKDNEDEIDNLVTSNTTVVINIGEYDAKSHSTYADLYIEWLNKKAEEWVAVGATVYYMNVGPVVDRGSSYTKTSHVSDFNKKVKEGLGENIRYIDLHTSLENYGKIVYDGSGVLYDSETYDVIWRLITNTVVG